MHVLYKLIILFRANILSFQIGRKKSIAIKIRSLYYNNNTNAMRIIYLNFSIYFYFFFNSINIIKAFKMYSDVTE